MQLTMLMGLKSFNSIAPSILGKVVKIGPAGRTGNQSTIRSGKALEPFLQKTGRETVEPAQNRLNRPKPRCLRPVRGRSPGGLTLRSQVIKNSIRSCMLSDPNKIMDEK